MPAITCENCHSFTVCNTLANFCRQFTASVKSSTPNHAYVEVVKELPRSLIGKRVLIEITELV